MLQLVVNNHFSDIGSLYWEKLQQHGPCRILRISVNRESTISNFPSSVIYVQIGCRHPLIKYWQALLAKTTATCSLPLPENERQLSVNNYSCCIFGNQGIAHIFAIKKGLLTVLIGNNAIYQSYIPNSKLINIACCKACKNISLVVENAILIIYYQQTPKTNAVYESINGPAGRPTDSPLNSDGLEVYRQTITMLMVRAYWQPGLPIWQRLGLNPDPDLKWRSGSVANTRQLWFGKLSYLQQSNLRPWRIQASLSTWCHSSSHRGLSRLYALASQHNTPHPASFRPAHRDSKYSLQSLLREESLPIFNHVLIRVASTIMFVAFDSWAWQLWRGAFTSLRGRSQHCKVT